MTATVMEPDTSLTPFESLKQQFEARRQQDAIQKRETDAVHVRQASDGGEEVGGGVEEEQDTADSEKREFLSFFKGEERFDVDPEALFEFKADGKTHKMTLKELRDAAAGGVAVRNRMRQLSEQKKDLLQPYENFSRKAKENPLSALKTLFSAAQRVDKSLDFNVFISDLTAQAKRIRDMAPAERKSFELEERLREREEAYDEQEQTLRLQELKNELAAETGLSDEKIYIYGQNILKDPILSQTIKTEEDLITRIGDLAEEIELQQASVEALHKINPKISPRDPLVFELSRVLRQNPDFDEKDLEDLAREVLGVVHKSNAAQKLSKKQRSSVIARSQQQQARATDYSKMTPFEALKAQIEAKKQQEKNRMLK